jgi:hypothetical protein
VVQQLGSGQTHDRDLEYISSFVDPREVKRLRRFEACLCGPPGNFRFVTRPPYSKVRHLADSQKAFLFEKSDAAPRNLSEDEIRILRAVHDHHVATGDYLNLMGAMRAAGLRSKGRTRRLVQGLEQKGLVTTRLLPNRRGTPRVIIPVDRTMDQTGTKQDGLQR